MGGRTTSHPGKKVCLEHVDEGLLKVISSYYTSSQVSLSTMTSEPGTTVTWISGELVIFVVPLT